MIIKSLKVCVIVLCTIVLGHAQQQDILMTVGGQNVSLDEFKYIYEKNNGDKADYSQASLDEYLDLYKRFKLKVVEAKSMKLDTIETLKEELQGYRNQLATSYIMDKEITDKLVDEVYRRKKQDVELQHILLQLRGSSTPQKRQDIEKRLLDIKKNIESTGVRFGNQAGKFSEDRNSAKNRGYLGYTTAMLPDGLYALENAAYDAPVGEVVGPIWTDLGCHLVVVKNRRPARGVRKVSHLLVKKTGQGKAKIDKIYQELTEGGNWKTLVLSNSDDKKTNRNGGLLPAFGIATYETAFEDAAFGLEKVGDITKPVRSSSGWHIIRLEEIVEPETKEELKDRLKDDLKKYDRYKERQEAFNQSTLKEGNYKLSESALESFANYVDNTFYSYKWKPGTVDDQELFTLGSKSYMLSEFAEFCKKNIAARSRINKKTPLSEGVEILFDKYLQDAIVSYMQEDIDARYPGFKSLMREYEEGILLFEATKRMVWDKANQDSIGLTSFYNKNKSNYQNPRQAMVGTYTLKSANPKLIKKVTKCARKHSTEKTLKRFNKKEEVLSYTEKSYPDSELTKMGLMAKKSSLSEAAVDTKLGRTVFQKVVSLSPASTKPLNEARGYVIADYQDELEQNWIKKLMKKHPIKVNKNVLEKLYGSSK